MTLGVGGLAGITFGGVAGGLLRGGPGRGAQALTGGRRGGDAWFGELLWWGAGLGHHPCLMPSMTPRRHPPQQLYEQSVPPKPAYAITHA